MKQRAFTIVELLIVIVVIGILAAITIVAYNGIQERARGSAAAAALNQSAKKIALWKVEASSDTAPDCATFASQIGSTVDPQNSCISTKDAISYQYKQTSGSTSYCITATTGTTSYKLDSATSSTPGQGACSGHGSGGVGAITNLVLNPGIESDMTSWTTNWGTSGAGATTRRTDGAPFGSAYIRATWTTASTSPNGGVYYNHPSNGQISEGTTYTASASVRVSRTQRMKISLYWINSSGAAVTTVDGPQVVLSPGAWTRMSVTAQAPTGAVRYFIVPFATAGTSYSPWAANDYVDADGMMLTEGSTLYTYADGSSAGWAWNGTANASTSSGPPL
jgi:prepilin-type N-terminal cleavage/methylation domain-containing protein